MNRKIEILSGIIYWLYGADYESAMIDIINAINKLKGEEYGR